MRKLSKRDNRFVVAQNMPNTQALDSLAQDQRFRDTDVTAQSIVNIIGTLGSYVSPDMEMKFRDSVRDKVYDLSPTEMASKEMPAGARVGQAITLMKSFLNGQDEAFIAETLRKIVEKL